MEIMFPCCAGLDVHKETVEAHVRRMEPDGRLYQQTSRWGAMTGDLLGMSDWLAAQGVTHVAMKSTSVSWKPVYNILEGRFQLLLVNAQHIQEVPARGTDVSDCQWIAQLLQHGLLRGSLVPSRKQRELRDLTRHRARLIAEKTRTVNRIQKILENANIKLGVVSTGILEASGPDLIRALLGGEQDPVKLADLIPGRSPGNIPLLEEALEGQVTDHHRFQLQILWDHWTSLEALIQRLDSKINERPALFEEQGQPITQVNGIERRAAETVVAPVGAEVSPYPTEGHLASGTEIARENQESARQTPPVHIRQERCPKCGSSRVRRSRRSSLREYLAGFLLFHPYRCRECHHRFLSAQKRLQELFYARCPRCGNQNLERIAARKVPVRWFRTVSRLIPRRAYRCDPCRWRFFDLRRLAPGEAPRSEPSPSEASTETADRG